MVGRTTPAAYLPGRYLPAHRQRPLGSARYDEECVRTGGGWKSGSLRLTSRFWTPNTEGWERRRDHEQSFFTGNMSGGSRLFVPLRRLRRSLLGYILRP